jgi:hypothetical protein
LVRRSLNATASRWKIARSARHTPFTAFADKRPIPDDFDGDADALHKIMGERSEWFDPAERCSSVLF